MAHRVLVVEDDPVFRTNFVHAVRSAPDMALVGEAEDLPEGLRLLQQTQPDVLLVDIGLPSGSGIELIRYADEHLPECDVMVVTVFGDERHVVECIEAGATGYLLKGSSALAIVEQVRTLRSGGSPISPLIARQLLRRMLPAPTSPPPASKPQVPTQQVLSGQECTVLELCSKGYNFDEIARLLSLSRHTIETYIKRIYRKLQVHSKTEAIYEARKLGLVSD